jgi:hypothetical protein
MKTMEKLFMGGLTIATVTMAGYLIKKKYVAIRQEMIEAKEIGEREDI